MSIEDPMKKRRAYSMNGNTNQNVFGADVNYNRFNQQPQYMYGINNPNTGMLTNNTNLTRGDLSFGNVTNQQTAFGQGIAQDNGGGGQQQQNGIMSMLGQNPYNAAAGMVGYGVGALNPYEDIKYEGIADQGDISQSDQARLDEVNIARGKMEDWDQTRDNIANSNIPVIGGFIKAGHEIGNLGMQAFSSFDKEGSSKWEDRSRNIFDPEGARRLRRLRQVEAGDKQTMTGFAYGGPMNQGMGDGNLTEYNGNGHEQGGLPLGQDIEVEDGETNFDDYVFSDRIMYDPKKKISFADESKRINKKYDKRKGDKYAEEAKERELSTLRDAQELLKASEGFGNGNVPQGGDNAPTQGLNAPTHAMPNGEQMPGATHQDYMQGNFAYGGEIPPYKSANPYLLPEYNQPMSGDYILPDANRPSANISDMSMSEYKMGIDEDGKEILIPKVVAGQYLNDDDAVKRYGLTGERFKSTGNPNSYTNFYNQVVKPTGLTKNKRALGGDKGGYKSFYDYDELNAWNPDTTTGNAGAKYLPLNISNNYRRAMNRGNKMFNKLQTLYPDSKEYTPQQLQEAGLADAYYDNLQYASMINKKLGRDYNTSGTDEYGKGLNTPVKEQIIGDRHRGMFNPVSRQADFVPEEDIALTRTIRANGGPTGRRQRVNYGTNNNIDNRGVGTPYSIYADRSQYDFNNYTNPYISPAATTDVDVYDSTLYDPIDVASVGGKTTSTTYPGIITPLAKDREIDINTKTKRNENNINNTSGTFTSKFSGGGSMKRKKMVGGGPEEEDEVINIGQGFDFINNPYMSRPNYAENYLEQNSPGYIQPRSSDYDFRNNVLYNNLSFPTPPTREAIRDSNPLEYQVNQYMPNNMQLAGTRNMLNARKANPYTSGLRETYPLLNPMNQALLRQGTQEPTIDSNGNVVTPNTPLADSTGTVPPPSGDGTNGGTNNRFEPGMGYGLAASMAGPLYNILGPGSRPDDVNFDRVNLNPEEISYEEAAREARRAADINRSYARRAMTESGASAGQLMSNIGATGAQIAQQEGSQLANIYEQEENANVLARNEADRINQMSNAQIQMQESIARQQEKDTAASTVGFGIANLGSNVGQFLSDVRKNNVQDDVMKYWMSTANYTATPKGALYTNTIKDGDDYITIGKNQSTGKWFKQNDAGNWMPYDQKDSNNKTTNKTNVSKSNNTNIPDHVATMMQGGDEIVDSVPDGYTNVNGKFIKNALAPNSRGMVNDILITDGTNYIPVVINGKKKYIKRSWSNKFGDNKTFPKLPSIKYAE